MTNLVGARPSLRRLTATPAARLALAAYLRQELTLRVHHGLSVAWGSRQMKRKIRQHAMEAPLTPDRAAGQVVCDLAVSSPGSMVTFGLQGQNRAHNSTSGTTPITIQAMPIQP